MGYEQEFNTFSSNYGEAFGKCRLFLSVRYMGKFFQLIMSNASADFRTQRAAQDHLGQILGTFEYMSLYDRLMDKSVPRNRPC